jgi:hypothetical protein
MVNRADRVQSTRPWLGSEPMNDKRERTGVAATQQMGLRKPLPESTNSRNPRSGIDGDDRFGWQSGHATRQAYKGDDVRLQP